MSHLGAGVSIAGIWQRLGSVGDQIWVENRVQLTVPLLGTWRLQAEGSWLARQDLQTVTVQFQALSIQAVHLLGQRDWQFPAPKIPVLELLRREALWTTSYLDQDLRIGRGATGNLFVFQRTESLDM